MMRRIKILVLSLLPLLFSCDYIDENERFIVVDSHFEQPNTESVAKNVLLEDFTGQRCVNCPRGSEVIEQLQEAYPERLIAVGIHGGPLGFSGSAMLVGLATAVGDDYYHHWHLEYQPVGLVNRGDAVNYTDWMNAVRQALTGTTALSMNLTATLHDGQVDITVSETLKKGTYTGKLQVWLLEDGITALQMMPDGSSNRAYVHNHVLRTPVNGTWGDSFTIDEGESKQQEMTQALDASWNPSNLSIVAFVYNDAGVEQVVKTKVK